MRGDSIRDLHAKVLALCGLGLLAGAGALVDYWPVQDPLPPVFSRTPAVEPIRARAVPSNPKVVVAPAPAARTARSTNTSPRAEHPTLATPVQPEPVPAAPDFANLPISTAALVADSSIILAPPPTERPEAAMPIAASLPPAAMVTRVSLKPPPLGNDEPAIDRADDDGLITGALKKTGAVAGAGIARTGDALAWTGAVAGASIRDMFRGLAGAMKKVSPFGP